MGLEVRSQVRITEDGCLAFSASMLLFSPAMIGDHSVDRGTLSEVNEPGN